MKYTPGYLVDNTWLCKHCGAFNAAYLEKCGRCEKPKPKKDE